MNLLIYFAILFLVLLACILLPKNRVSQQFLRKWPPISDDEFVRRCQPGTPREIALRVRLIVSRQLGIPYENIYPEQHFVKDLDTE